MRAAHLELRGFRNLLDADVTLGDGVTTIHGQNGAGKTNLLEALYFGLAGRSFRASRDREAIRFGEDMARVTVELTSSPELSQHPSADGLEGTPGRPTRFLASVDRSGERRLLVDGNPLSAVEAAAKRPALAVFVPDRLGLVKGPPSTRRAHLDQLVSALWPARAGIRSRYGAALAQRNALLGRVRAGAVGSSALDGWDLELASQGVALRQVRGQAVAALAAGFERLAEALGLSGQASVRYAERGPTGSEHELVSALRERRDSDLKRGFTGSGPHADELELELNGRALRRYGSQGQQRTAVLALLLAERDAVIELGRPAPLTLLDDVMSELDLTRRERLAERLAGGGQALITAADSSAVPDMAGTRILVRDGRIEARGQAPARTEDSRPSARRDARDPGHAMPAPRP